MMALEREQRLTAGFWLLEKGKEGKKSTAEQVEISAGRGWQREDRVARATTSAVFRPIRGIY